MHPYEASMKLPDKDCRVKVTFKPEFFDGQKEILWWIPQSNVQAFWRRKFNENGEVVETTPIWWRWVEWFDVLQEVE